MDGHCVPKCDPFTEVVEDAKQCKDNKCPDTDDTKFTKEDGKCVEECDNFIE